MLKTNDNSSLKSLYKVNRS